LRGLTEDLFEVLPLPLPLPRDNIQHGDFEHHYYFLSAFFLLIFCVL
jgi:hypothetical protein